MKNVLTLALFFVGVVVCSMPVLHAQSTEFSFQGSMKDGAAAANGNYDFEFRLYNAVSGGSQVGLTLTQSLVAVTNGTFSVQLDFGANYPGANRFLEIRVRQTGGGTFTPLTPRQPVLDAPYSVKSLNTDNAVNATQLGGVAANQYVVTTDPRMSNARNPLAGSTNYIQNTTEFQQFAGFDIGGIARIRGDLIVDGVFSANLPPNNPNYIQNRSSQQSLSNFNVSGNGTIGGTLNAPTVSSTTVNASTVNATTVDGNIFNAVIVDSTVYRIGGSNVLRNFGTQNISVGVNAGGAGADNSFFGFNAGNGILAGGTDNSFFGSDAGGINSTGSANSFFGSDTGDSNTTGLNNSFFGRSAGGGNSTGDDNSFFGHNAGLSSSTANGNSFFGKSAGQGATGTFNSIFGANAGQAAGSGGSNAFFGYLAGGANTSGTNNSFFGKNAGDSNQGGSFNSFVGTLAGTNNTSGSSNTFVGINAGDTNTTGSNNTVIGGSADFGANNLNYATAIGAGTVVGRHKQHDPDR